MKLILASAGIALAAIAAGGWYVASSPEPSMPVIQDFRQTSPSNLQIAFDRPVADVELQRLLQVPENDLDEAGVVRSALSANAGKVDVALSEADLSGEYSLVLHLRDARCDGVRGILASVGMQSGCSDGYVEIIRQPANWLKAQFSFDRANGYSILGRRNLLVRSAPSLSYDPLVFAGIPDIASDAATLDGLPEVILEQPELTRAAQLIRLLWNRELRGGPTSLPYLAFLKEPFDRKLQLVGDGETAVMCQGIRDMFLHATLASPQIKARAVEAMNYGPSFDDLVPYGHSTSEVWVEGLKKWVLMDAWMGFALADEQGRLLSAEDLRSANRPEEIHPIALLPKVHRFATTPAGLRIETEVDPATVSMEGYTFTPVGHAPGYLIYFEDLHYRDYLADPVAEAATAQSGGGIP